MNTSSLIQITWSYPGEDRIARHEACLDPICFKAASPGGQSPEPFKAAPTFFRGVAAGLRGN